MKIVKKDELSPEDAQVVEEVISEPKVEEKTQEELKKEFEDKVRDHRTFAFGNLQLECGRCGHIETLELGVESGIQIVLPTTDKHELKMVCPKCRNFTRLYFTENLVKQKIEKDGPETEDKETESVQGVTESN